MSFLNLMGNKLKPTEVNEALESGGGGVDIPTPTASDNGKVLGVSDANYALINISTDVTFLSLMTARTVVQLKAKDDDPNHDYIGIKIGSGEWTYYKYTELPDLSQYGITISYTSPNWTVKLFNFFTIDGDNIYYYNDEVKWQYQEDKYSHTFVGYNIPVPSQTSRKKKSSK